MEKQISKSMMLVKSIWNEKPTFKMMPISDECPYIECIYDPDSSVFVVISKTKKTTLHMLPDLDSYGVRVTGTKGAKQSRHKMEVFQEYYIDDVNDMKNIIDIFAKNSDSFDYSKYITEKKAKDIPVAQG
jgi:hypothetical protein